MTEVPGIGPARARLLARLGVETVGGLLHRPPRDYVDARRPTPVAGLQEGRTAVVIGAIVTSSWRRARRGDGLWVGTARLRDDDGGELQLVWFAKGRGGRRPRPLPPPNAARLVAVVGVPRRTDDGWVMSGPDVESAHGPSPHIGRIVPVYSLTEGLSQKIVRNAVWAALDRFGPFIEDPLSALTEELPEGEGFDVEPLATALRQLHFPKDWDALHRARQRLAFAELLFLRLVAAKIRRDTALPARILPGGEPAFVGRLPFRLTQAQRRVAQEIDRDLARDCPMQRLLQGDVGSGKTVVAAWALAKAAAAGGQGVLIAPSDLLARQHYAALSNWLAPDGIAVELLTGSTKPGDRTVLLRRLAAGEPVVVVGTHALLQPSVSFARLDVVVVDEQHRFGVEQRRKLLQGERPPHLLVVSATPIPRTLAHCVYGDLDVSVLDELPPGRLPVDTRWVRPARRHEVYRFVRHRVEKGEQAFVVFPAIGDDEDDGASVGGHSEYSSSGTGTIHLLSQAEALTEGPLAGLTVDVVHGRLRAEEQAEAFEKFRTGQTSVLLATTVVEVGVDVPRASVIVIEGADKFGLAQLHQLRGRVGRGGGQGWCFLVADPTTPVARRRLQSMRETKDGFSLARKDLALRGPGELLGLRQSGLPDLSPLGQTADERTLQAVHRWAEVLLRPQDGPPSPARVRLWEAVDGRAMGSATAAGV